MERSGQRVRVSSSSDKLVLPCGIGTPSEISLARKEPEAIQPTIGDCDVASAEFRQ